MGTAEDAERVVREFCAACENHDAEALRPFFDDDVVYHNIPMDPAVGIDATIAFIAGFFAMCERVVFDIAHLAVHGDVVLTERIDTFTVGSVVAPLPVMGTFEVRDGKIRAWRDYFDMAQATKVLSGERADVSDTNVDGVAIETESDVLHIVLDRPERKNALDPPAVARIVSALEAAAVDDSLRAIVLRSSSADFCTGADWVATNRGDGPRPRTGSIQRRTPLGAHRLVELLIEVQLPVVCAVRGWAAGLGCQIALAADFTVATESSRFWEPFLERGFTPDSGATWLLPRLVGIARAKELLILGRKVTGQEAADWGLIHRAVADDELDEVVHALVSQLASAATVALGLTKRAIHRALDSSLTDAMEVEANGLELSSRSADFKEGLVAFREKRPPRFEGR